MNARQRNLCANVVPINFSERFFCSSSCLLTIATKLHYIEGMKKVMGKTLMTSSQNKHLRKSPARDAVLDILGNAGKPLPVSEIMASLANKGRSVNKTTVYREIETLKKMGSVREIFFRNDTALYECVGDHHHHLVCVSCGDIREVRLNESLEREESRLARRERFTILDHSLEFFGMCERCR